MCRRRLTSLPNGSDASLAFRGIFRCGSGGGTSPGDAGVGLYGWYFFLVAADEDDAFDG